MGKSLPARPHAKRAKLGAMKRVFVALALVLGVVAWCFSGRGNLSWRDGLPIVPHASLWPLGAWGLPLVTLFLLGGAAGLSVYDRFRRAKTRKEQTNSTLTALICMALLGALWPWTLLGPGAPMKITSASQLSRLTFDGRFNLLAAQWSDVATQYLGTAYQINDPRAFCATYASAQQHPTSRALAHVATHPPGATLWFYGVRRFVESLPALGEALNGFAATLSGLEEAKLLPLLAQLRETASLSASVAAPPPLPRGALGVALLCAILQGLAIPAALPAVYGLATSFGKSEAEEDADAGGNNSLDGENNGATEARGLLACALWVLAPSLNLYAFSLDALVACGAAWTLFFAARAFTTRKRRWALAAGLALALSSMLSFGALALGLVLLVGGLLALEGRFLIRTLALAGGAFVLAWIGAGVWGGFNPLEVAHLATGAHEFATLSVRSYAPWVGLNLWIWAIFCGWPLVVALVGGAGIEKELIIRSRIRIGARRPDIAWAFASGTILTLCALSLSGQVRGEVERLWLFLLCPLAACALVGNGKSAVALVGLQAVQTLAMAAALAPLIRPI